jgi:adenosylcobinamide-GDP ribazoletransferase
MRLPFARQDGLARRTGQPDFAIAATAAIIALIIALLSLSWANAFWAAILAGLSAAGMAWLAKLQIGGQTGDVLGATEQICETAILVLLAAKLG